MLQMKNTKPTQEKLADLGALASGLVHEIRNPLNAIKANLQLMQEDVEREEREEEGPHSRRVQRLLKEVDRLDKILSDFLAFVRSDELKRKLCDLSVLIQEVVSLITPQAEAEGVTVLSDLTQSVYSMVDTEAMKQAIMNLAMNGIQAIGENKALSKTLIFKLGKLEKGGKKFAAISVIDTGKGISEEEIKHIYELFFTTRSGGTGIGLAVVSRIIQSHGGEIRCESEIGKGTSFDILLPLEAED